MTKYLCVLKLGHTSRVLSICVTKYLCVLKLGHTSRVLHMAMSPDGSTVVSAAADETLRLWKCFAVDPQKKAQKSVVQLETGIMRKMSIR